MIYKLHALDIPSLSQVGGKAKALIETTKAGETKYLYADLVKLSQGFEESPSMSR